jgi:hypothetical protein
VIDGTSDFKLNCNYPSCILQALCAKTALQPRFKM